MGHWKQRNRPNIVDATTERMWSIKTISLRLPLDLTIPEMKIRYAFIMTKTKKQTLVSA